MREQTITFFTKAHFFFFFFKIMLESWGGGLYTSAAYTRVFTVINLLSCTKRRNIFRGTAIIQGSKAKVIMHNPQKLLTKNNIFLPRKYL